MLKHTIALQHEVRRYAIFWQQPATSDDRAGAGSAFSRAWMEAARRSVSLMEPFPAG